MRLKSPPQKGGGWIAWWIGCSLLVATAAQDGDEIRIGIIGDQSGAPAGGLSEAYRVLEKAVEVLNLRRLDVVLHTGDLIESRLAEDVIRKDFLHASSILARLQAPWKLSAGDHDVNPPEFQQLSPDRSRETLFRQLYQPLNPAVSASLHYSFEVKGYHFVALNSLQHLDTDPRWGNVFLNTIDDRQFDWLKKDLEAHSDATGIVVFLHHPMWYNWSGWSRVHALLRRFPVRAVIAGHFHYNQRDSLLDGIQYWVVGAAGGRIKDATPNAGGLHHVSVLSIGPSETLRFELLPIPPATQAGWTPRPIMDRIQAIEQSLDSLWNFADENPLFLRDDSLSAACDQQAPAVLRLTSIGNPTPEPLLISIRLLNPEGARIASGRFVEGLCQEAITDTACELTPSAGIRVANPSVVFAVFPPSQPAPFWSGSLESSGSPPEPKTPVRLRIEMSFQAGGETFSVRKTVESPLRSCER